MQAHFQGVHTGVSPDQVSSERNNLVAALHYALERDELEQGLQVFGSQVFWWSLGVSSIWNQWRQVLLARRDTLPPAIRSKAITLLGRTAWTARDYAEAARLFEESIASHQAGSDMASRAETLWYLADVRRDQGEYACAGVLYQESLAHFHQLSDKQRSAWVYHSWAELALLQDDLARTMELQQASLGLFSAIGEKVGMVLNVN